MSPVTLFIVAMVVLGVLFVIAFAAIIGVFFWANRSDSPRAARIRHLLGDRGTRRQDGAKSIHWLGEEVVLRREAAKAFAAGRQWRYAQADSVLPRLSVFRELFPGETTMTEDVIRWEGEGRSFVLATIIAAASPTRETRSTYTVLVIDALDLLLPPFSVKGETIAHKSLFAAHDIDFPGDAEFSNRYHLESSDEAGVRRLFTREVRKSFMDADDCLVECVSSSVLFRELELTTVRGYELFVDESLALFRAIARASATKAASDGC